MLTLLKARCARVSPNNGIVEARFTLRSDPYSQEEHVLVNLRKDRGAYEVGRDYWIHIEPAC